MMAAKSALTRITLFTRSNCGLCASAKEVLNKVHARQPILNIETIDIMNPTHKKWKIYEFDVPVVCVEKTEKEK